MELTVNERGIEDTDGNDDNIDDGDYDNNEDKY